MTYIKTDYSNTYPFFGSYTLESFQNEITFFHNKIHDKLKSNHEPLGWIDYPAYFDQGEFDRIKFAAENVQRNSEILLVIGIGGSYMGARAAIEMLTHSFNNNLSKEQRIFPQIFFVGNNLSSTYMTDLMDLLKDKDFSINVISKSGQTLETAIAFRVFRSLLEKKYGKKNACSRIYVTTDCQKSTLKDIAEYEGYKTFYIPENIGGRFSVLTAVGLFPISVSGICINEIMAGAFKAKTELNQKKIMENPAYQYAAIRNILYNNDKTIEILISYEPSFKYFSEWWKQLYAESEGKNFSGIFPTTAIYSTDLHSLGQYVQEGRRDIFETVIKIGKMKREIIIEEKSCDLDNLNYLGGKTLDYINEKVFEGTLSAHTKGGIPNVIIQIPESNAFSFGYLVYFFKLACAMSGYLLGVNPFDQPGVEAYKKNMFYLLGKPDYIKEKLEIN